MPTDTGTTDALPGDPAARAVRSEPDSRKHHKYRDSNDRGGNERGGKIMMNPPREYRSEYTATHRKEHESVEHEDVPDQPEGRGQSERQNDRDDDVSR